jgi:hypothetical protein
LTKTGVIELAVSELHKQVPQWFKDAEGKRRKELAKESP